MENESENVITEIGFEIPKLDRTSNLSVLSLKEICRGICVNNPFILLFYYPCQSEQGSMSILWNIYYEEVALACTCSGSINPKTNTNILTGLAIIICDGLSFKPLILPRKILVMWLFFSSETATEKIKYVLALATYSIYVWLNAVDTG